MHWLESSSTEETTKSLHVNRLVLSYVRQWHWFDTTRAFHLCYERFNHRSLSKFQQHETTEINKPCILSTRGRLFYDPVAKILYHCDGAKWVPWKRTSLKSGKQKLLTQNSEEKFCEDGWKSFEHR